MDNFDKLYPERVFYYFSQICSIPHGSGNSDAIADYCEKFALEHKLRYIRDKYNNLIIFKDASLSRENDEPIIIQGHLDMVCEKTGDSDIDFSCDGLKLCYDGSYIFADKTTLGGDDGIAIAYALAILESDSISHPSLEVIFTTDEEIGLLGAAAIDLSPLKGRFLINIDSEEEGVFLSGCAGGLSLEASLPVNRVKRTGTPYTITLSGLTGGHSGCEIDKGRGNSNILCARLLMDAPCFITDIRGGTKENAIPRETVVELIVSDEAAFRQSIELSFADIKNEFSSTDPGISLDIRKADSAPFTSAVLDETSHKKLLMALLNIPDGVQSMSHDMEGLVETSLNLGILTSNEESINFLYCVRSSVDSAKNFLSQRIRFFFEYLGGAVEFSGIYPGWKFQKYSPLRNVFSESYKELYGKEPLVCAIHAGLECGMFVEKINNLDCISIGPDISDIHTTEEKMNVKSVARTFDLLISVLKKGITPPES